MFILSLEICVSVHRNIFCRQNFLYSVQKSFASQKKLLVVPQNIHISVQIFSECTEIFGLAQNYLAHPQKIIRCAEIFFKSHKK